MDKGLIWRALTIAGIGGGIVAGVVLLWLFVAWALSSAAASGRLPDGGPE